MLRSRPGSTAGRLNETVVYRHLSFDAQVKVVISGHPLEPIAVHPAIEMRKPCCVLKCRSTMSARFIQVRGLSDVLQTQGSKDPVLSKVIAGGFLMAAQGGYDDRPWMQSERRHGQHCVRSRHGNNRLSCYWSTFRVGSSQPSIVANRAASHRWRTFSFRKMLCT